MESIILYELARNNVYGALSRALEGLQQNCLGLLSTRRYEHPDLPIRNDAFFFVQTAMARHTVVALKEFTDARLQGVAYYEARALMMNNFIGHVGAPFNDEDFALFMPSYQDGHEDKSDLEKEEIYRYRHLDEFRTTLQVLDIYLRHHQMLSWGHEAVFDQMYRRLESFIDPAMADRGFDKFPVPQAVQYLADAVVWFKQRSLAAQFKSSFGAAIDDRALPDICANAGGSDIANKVRFAHYSAHYEAMGTGLAAMICNGSYLQLLRDSCPVAPDAELSELMDFRKDAPANLPLALADFAMGYKDHFAANFKREQADPAFAAAAISAAEESVADVLSAFAVTRPVLTKSLSPA